MVDISHLIFICDFTLFFQLGIIRMKYSIDEPFVHSFYCCWPPRANTIKVVLYNTQQNNKGGKQISFYIFVFLRRVDFKNTTIDIIQKQSSLKSILRDCL